MTELPPILDQSHPVHRAHDNDAPYRPMVEGRFEEIRREQEADASAYDVLDELFHAEVYNG